MSEDHRTFVELKGVSRWFGNVVAVNDISFGLRPGITGLLGPNGAGKSTVINMMAGLLRPSSGSVSVGGVSSWHNPDIYRDLGLVPERESVYGFLTAREFIGLNARLQGVGDIPGAVRTAIETVGLTEAQDRRLDTFSKGMKQRAKLASALVHHPRILILDEPFNGLDPRQRRQMMHLLRAEAASGKAVLVSSHILEEVDRIADRVLVMISGRLAASGPPREIRKLMTDRPHGFTIRSSDDRRLASLVVSHLDVISLDIASRHLTVKAADYQGFIKGIAPLARDSDVTIYEMIPMDESLESVFTYLVEGQNA
jgi:ABC-2 type transport system ATP-binding protein